jgi:hypothetical protein
VGAGLAPGRWVGGGVRMGSPGGCANAVGSTLTAVAATTKMQCPTNALNVGLRAKRGHPPHAGCRPLACTQGSRAGGPGRSGAARRASIAQRAACRVGLARSGPRSGVQFAAASAAASMSRDARKQPVSTVGRRPGRAPRFPLIEDQSDGCFAPQVGVAHQPGARRKYERRYQAAALRKSLESSDLQTSESHCILRSEAQMQGQSQTGKRHGKLAMDI